MRDQAARATLRHPDVADGASLITSSEMLPSLEDQVAAIEAAESDRVVLCCPFEPFSALALPSTWPHEPPLGPPS